MKRPILSQKPVAKKSFTPQKFINRSHVDNPQRASSHHTFDDHHKDVHRASNDNYRNQNRHSTRNSHRGKDRRKNVSTNSRANQNIGRQRDRSPIRGSSSPVDRNERQSNGRGQRQSAHPKQPQSRRNRHQQAFGDVSNNSNLVNQISDSNVVSKRNAKVVRGRKLRPGRGRAQRVSKWSQKETTPPVIASQ